MNRPLNIDVSELPAPAPASLHDAICDRERAAFAHYTLKRVQKAPRTGADAASIYVGGIMALVQFAYAAHGGNAPVDARARLHVALDFAWSECGALALRD